MYHNQANYFFVLYEQEFHEELKSTIGKTINSHSPLQGTYKGKHYDLSNRSDELRSVFMQLNNSAFDAVKDCHWFASALTGLSGTFSDTSSSLLYIGNKDLPKTFDYNQIPVGSFINMDIEYLHPQEIVLDETRRELFYQHEKTIIDNHFKDLGHYFLIYKQNGGTLPFISENILPIFTELVTYLQLNVESKDGSVKSQNKSTRRYIRSILTYLQGIDIDFFSPIYNNNSDINSLFSDLEKSSQYDAFVKGKIHGLYGSMLDNEKLQKKLQKNTHVDDPNCLSVPTHAMVYIGNGLVISKLGRGPICVSTLQEMLDYYIKQPQQEGGNDPVNGIQLYLVKE